MKRARPAFLTGPVEYNVYSVAEDAWVDDSGNIRSAETPVQLKQVRYVGGQRIVKEKFDAPLPKV